MENFLTRFSDLFFFIFFYPLFFSYAHPPGAQRWRISLSRAWLEPPRARRHVAAPLRVAGCFVVFEFFFSPALFRIDNVRQRDVP